MAGAGDGGTGSRAGPATAAPATAPEAPDRPDAGSGAGGGSALFVGLDATASRLCGEIMNRRGLAVAEAETGVAAVTAVRARVPDLILLDLQLRDVRGSEAIRWLRTNPGLARTPIVVFGAETAAEDGRRGVVWLRKPVSLAVLDRVIEALVAPAPGEASP